MCVSLAVGVLMDDLRARETSFFGFAVASWQHGPAHQSSVQLGAVGRGCAAASRAQLRSTPRLQCPNVLPQIRSALETQL